MGRGQAKLTVEPSTRLETRVKELHQALEAWDKQPPSAERDQALYAMIFDDDSLRADLVMGSDPSDDHALLVAKLEESIYQHWQESSHGPTANMDWADDQLRRLLT